MNEDEPRTARLDELLLIGAELRRLDIARLVDERVRPDPRSRVTHGQCIEALVASILLGKHTLYAVGELLDPYDLELTLGFRGATARQLHDFRLAKAMDALFDAGVQTVSSAALLRAVEVHDLELDRLHLDTTSVAVYGDYANSESPEDPEDPQAIPEVTRGYSKDNRGDLKQVIYSLAVTGDGAVPAFARVASGNRADPKELRFLVEQLAHVLPDPTQSTLVGDSKFFCAPTLRSAISRGFDIVTMLPRTTVLWGEAFTAYRRALSDGTEPRTLKAIMPPLAEDEDQDEDAEPLKDWVGLSFSMDYSPKAEAASSGSAAEGETNPAELAPIPLRLLVVESSTLREQRTASAQGRRAKERAKLDRAVEKVHKLSFQCEADAEQAAREFCARNGPDFHYLTTAVERVTREIKRPRRGRPRSGEAPPTEEVWVVRVTLDDDDEILEEVVFRESCYVVVTTLPREGPKAADDVRVFEIYRQQLNVETSIRWAKNPLAVAPIFLKTEKRIAALGLVYLLALMVYALIQRHARRALADANEVVPGNRGVTSKPTTAVLFRLFHGIDVLRPTPGTAHAVVTRITEPQLDALRLLRHPMLEDPCVRISAPHAPRRARDKSYANWRQRQRAHAAENGATSGPIP